MSYARLHGKSRFYAFEDAITGNLKIHPHEDAGKRFLSINKKEVKQLKEIFEKYLGQG